MYHHSCLMRIITLRLSIAMALSVWGPRQHVNFSSHIFHPAAGSVTFSETFSENSVGAHGASLISSITRKILFLNRGIIRLLNFSGENPDHVSTTLGAAPRATRP